MFSIQDDNDKNQGDLKFVIIPGVNHFVSAGGIFCIWTLNNIRLIFDQMQWDEPDKTLKAYLDAAVATD